MGTRGEVVAAKRRVRALAAVALLAAAALPPLAARPAAAAVRSVQPAEATVTAGGTATATVSVEAGGVACLDARVDPPSATIQVSLARVCDSATFTTRLFVTTSVSTPPGAYHVAVSDPESSSTFRLVVTAPPPPTAPAPASTAPPATEAPTTVPDQTTTTAPGPPPTSPPVPVAPGTFTPLAELTTVSGPVEGLFLPLLGAAFQSCLPLAAACVDDAGILSVLPVTGAQIRWQAPAEGWQPPPALGGRGVPALEPVGVAPPRSDATFVLSVLDLARGSRAQLRSLLRGLDPSGAFTDAAGGDPLVVAAVDGAGEPADDSRFVGAAPFGPPERMASERLDEAWPALVVARAAAPQPLYGVVPDPGWGLGVDFVPLLGTAVPFLASPGPGRVGLFVPLPPGAPAPAAPAGAAGPEFPVPAGRDGRLPLVVLGLAVAAGAGLAAWRWRTSRP